MKNKAAPILAFLLILFCQNAYSQYTFHKHYPEPGFSVIQTADDGFLVGRLSGGANGDGILMKLNSAGDTLWTKTYGDTLADAIMDIVPTSDGGYIIGGTSDSYGSGFESDVYIIKIDALGNVNWSAAYGGSSYDQCERIRQTSDGGYIVLGFTQSFGAGDRDIYLLKLDSSGNLMWTKAFGGPDDDEGYSIEETASGYIIAGSTAVIGVSINAYLLKTDLSGNLIWSKKYSGSRAGFDLKILSDGGYVLAGRAVALGGTRPFLMRTDSLGNISWSKVFMQVGEAHGIDQTTDGHYIVTGGSGTLTKTDSAGNIIWTRVHPSGFSYPFSGRRVNQTTDGGFIISAQLEHPFSYYPMQILKTDSLGFVGCNDSSIVVSDSLVTFTAVVPGFSVNTGGVGIFVPTNTDCYCIADTLLCSGTVGIEEPIQEKAVLVYPNPNDGNMSLKYELAAGERGDLTIFDITGKKIATYVLDPSSSILTISDQQLKAGMYFYQVTLNYKPVQSDKLVIIH